MIGERMIPAPSDAALARIVLHATRNLRRVRPGRVGADRVALVTSDADFAWVCRHVVASDAQAPDAFAPCLDRVSVSHSRPL